jgi:hypothetical protein
MPSSLMLAIQTGLIDHFLSHAVRAVRGQHGVFSSIAVMMFVGWIAFGTLGCFVQHRVFLSKKKSEFAVVSCPSLLVKTSQSQNSLTSLGTPQTPVGPAAGH